MQGQTTLEVTNKSQLTNLRVSGNTTLTTLKCFNNALTTLNVTGCTALNDLSCSSNANLATITGLADCTAIMWLHCDYCAITSLPGVNNMTNITVLQARDNKLTTLQVTNKSKLRLLEVNGNTTLTTLNCFNNALTSLNVTNCSAMTSLYCYENQLSELSVQGCTALKTLLCFQNKISGTGMTTLVNSLPTRSASDPGFLRVLDDVNENNVITANQVDVARSKFWNPQMWNGNAWVDITASLRGDVNGDGSVKTALIDILMRGVTAPPTADVNQDNSLNISDVTALIDIILSGS